MMFKSDICLCAPCAALCRRRRICPNSTSRELGPAAPHVTFEGEKTGNVGDEIGRGASCLRLYCDRRRLCRLRRSGAARRGQRVRAVAGGGWACCEPLDSHSPRIREALRKSERELVLRKRTGTTSQQ